MRKAQLKNYKTFQVGLLQTKAYRNLRYYFSELLKAYNLSLPEWAFIGILCDEGPQRANVVAKILDVKPSFATRVSQSLHDKGFVTKKVDSKDQRSITIAMTPKGRSKANKIEKELRANLKDYLKNFSPEELTAYIKVLEKLSALRD